jgi:hypothetical protein
LLYNYSSGFTNLIHVEIEIYREFPQLLLYKFLPFRVGMATSMWEISLKIYRTRKVSEKRRKLALPEAGGLYTANESSILYSHNTRWRMVHVVRNKKTNSVA